MRELAITLTGAVLVAGQAANPLPQFPAANLDLFAFDPTANPHMVNGDGCRAIRIGMMDDPLDGAKLAPTGSYKDKVRAFIKAREPTWSNSQVDAVLPQVWWSTCDVNYHSVNLECTDDGDWMGWNAKCSKRWDVNFTQVQSREVCNLYFRMGSVNPKPYQFNKSEIRVTIWDAVPENSSIGLGTYQNVAHIVEEVRQGSATKARAWVHGWAEFWTTPPGLSNAAREVLGCVSRAGPGNEYGYHDFNYNQP